MTLASQIASDASSVFLNTDEFGESVTRIADGNITTTTTAIVEFQGEEWNEIEKVFEERGSLHILSTDSAERDDKWTVRGRTYKIERFHQPESGMRRIDIIAMRKTGARP